jgi:uncharacterized repeat protein (TIGR01451 family)
MSVSNADTQTASPGSSVIYNISLQNTGDANANINLSTTNTPLFWSAQLSSSQFTVNPGSTSTVYLTVGVPSNATADNFGKQIFVNALYETNQSKQVTTTTKVSQIFNFGMSVDGQFNKDIAPGTSGIFVLNISQVSQGNGVNYINLSPAGQQPDGPTISYSSNPANMQPFSITTVTVNVYVPQDAIAKQYPYILSGNSQGGGPAQTVNIIINVTHVWGLSPSPIDGVKYINPDSQTVFAINVNNTGNKADTFSISGVDFLSPAPGWSETHTGSIGPINPQNSGQSTVTVYAPLNASYPTSMQMRINFVSETNASITRNCTVTAVVNKINSTYVFANPFINTADPGGSTTFSIQVRNTGNGKSTIDLTLPQFPPFLTPSLDTPSLVEMLPGTNATVNLTVLVSKNAPVNDSNILIRATVHDTPTSSNFTVIVRVNQTYNLTVFPSGSYSQHVSPGFKSTYAVTIKNTGNGFDTITMSNGTAPLGLITYFDTYNVGLNPDTSVTINATVEVAKGTMPGTYNIDLKGTSIGGKSSGTTIIVIVDPYSVQIWASPASSQVKPGENGRYSIIVKNNGLARDTYFIDITKNPNNWASMDLPSPFIQLAGDSYLSFNLTVTIPIDAAVSNFNTTVMATSQGNASIFQAVDVLTSVSPIYNIDIIANNVNVSVEATDTVTYEVRVKNTGNTLDSFNLDMTGEKRSWATLSNSSIQLASGVSQVLNISVTVPDNEQPANWSIFFKATSLGNTSKSVQVQLTIQVKPKHDLDLSSGDFVTKKKGEPGTVVVFKVNVTNKGPEQDTVDLSLSGNHTGWATLSQDSVVLGAGASFMVNLTFTIPGNALPEDVLVKLTGRLKSNINRTKSLDYTLTVGQIYKLEISSLLSENSTAPGGFVTFSVKVKNTGSGNDTIQISAQSYSTWVSFSKSSMPLVSDAFENVTVTVVVPSKPLPVKGDYNISIMAKSIGNEAVMGNMTLVMTITQVYGVDVASNVTVSYTDPGQGASYSISVKNTGNGQDSFSLTKSGDHTDWVTFSTSSITLDGGMTGYVTMLVQVPNNAFPQNMSSRVNVKSQGNQSFQQNLSLTTTINLLYGLNLTAGDTFSELTSPGAAVFNLTVRNTGNSNDNMDFEAIGAHMDWVTFNTSSVLLGPANSTTVKVTVTPSWTTPYDKLSGTYISSIKVTSRGYSFATSTVNLTTKVNIVYGLSASWDSTAKTAGPGGKATFNVTITNSGNILDTYVLNAQTFTTWVTWSNNNDSIGANSLDTVMMTVNIPTGQANQDYIIKVEIKSLGNDSKKHNQDIRLTVSELFGVSLTTEDEAKDAGQGSTIVYTVKVKNTGNVLENIDIKILESNYKSWAILSTSSMQLDEKGEQEIAVTVNIPADQAAGNYAITLKAEVRDHTDFTAQLGLTTSVFYAVELITKEPKKSGKANDLITFNITVKNKGSGNDTFDLSLIDPNANWFVSFDYDNFELQKDKSRLVMLTLRIDKDALKQDYTISVKAASDGDTTKTVVLTLTVSVERTPALKLETNVQSQTGRPGMTLVYTFRLTNDGNGQDTFKLKIQEGDESNWPSLNKESTIMTVDQFEEMTVTISIPNDAPAGTYNHTVKVWSQDTESVFTTLTFRTKVEAVFNLQLTTEETSMEGEPGDTLAYSIKLENTGNAADTYDLQVKDLPNNWNYNSSLESIVVPAKGKILFSVWITISGDFAKSKADSYLYTLKLTSRGNDTIDKSLVLTTVVKQVYNIELSPQNGENRVSIDPNTDDKTFTVVVKNSGNGEDTVTFKVKRYPSGWSTTYFTFNPSAVTVQPGNTTTKTVSVIISASSLGDVDAGAYDFDIVALSENGNEFSQTKLYLDVIRGEVAALTSGDITLSKTSVNKGDVVSFTVTIRNSGNSDMQNVVVTLYASTNPVASKTITSKIKKGDTGQATLEWTTDSVGDFPIKISAKYGSVDPVELKLTQKVSVKEKGGGELISSANMPWLLMIVILVVVVAVFAATRRKRPMAPMPQPAPRPAPAPVRKPPMDEEEEDGDELPAGPKTGPAAATTAPMGEGAKPKIARIKCPKCGTTKDVTSPVRPIEVKCDKCGARLRLVK